MRQLHIIGFAGYAGAGKDEAAAAIMNKLPFLGYSFATPIRAGVAAAFGLDWETLTDRETKELEIDGLGKSPRELMQLFGTEFGRNLLGEDIWLRVANTMLDGVAVAPEYQDFIGVVIPDVRFENEAEWILGHGGHVIRIERPGVGPVNGHESEKPLPDHLVSYTLHNDKTVSDLWENATKMVTAIIEQGGADGAIGSGEAVEAGGC